MVRRRVLLSAIFATLGVALAGCAEPLSRGYYIGDYGRPTIAASGGPGRRYRVSIRGPPMIIYIRMADGGVCGSSNSAGKGCPAPPSPKELDQKVLRPCGRPRV